MPKQLLEEIDFAQSAYFAAYTGSVPVTAKNSFEAFLRDELAASEQEAD